MDEIQLQILLHDILLKNTSMMAKLAKETYGINKLHILMQSNSVGGPSSLASSSNRFFAENNLASSHPILKVYMDMLFSSRKGSGDGGWFSILFSSRLVLAALSTSLPISHMTSGYIAAARLVDQIMEDPNCPCKISFSWSDASSILCLIKSIIGTKGLLNLTSLSLQHLSVTILSAFLSSIYHSQSGSIQPMIFYRHVPGLSAQCTTVFTDAIIMDIPVPHQLIGHDISNVIVVLFDCSLEITQLSDDITVEIESPTLSSNNNDNRHSSSSSSFTSTTTTTTTSSSLKSIEYQILTNVANMFVRSGIGLVCCQRRIHPYLQKLLSERSIIFLQRLSIRFITAVQKLSGAKLLGNFSTSEANSESSVFNREVLGFLSHLQVRTMGGRKLVIAKSDPNVELYEYPGNAAEYALSRRRPAASVIIAMPTSCMCAELQTVFEDVVCVLSHCAVSPLVMPGGGCWQSYVADRIEDKLRGMGVGVDGVKTTMDSVDRAVMCGVRSFCDALRHCAHVAGAVEERGDAGAGDMPHWNNNDNNNYDIINKQRNGFHFETKPISDDTAVAMEEEEVCFRSPSGTCVQYFRKMKKKERRRRRNLSDHDHGDGQQHNDANDDDTDGCDGDGDGNGNTDDNSEDIDTVMVSHADVLDAYTPFIRAMHQAVEAAVCVLQIDGVVDAIPTES